MATSAASLLAVVLLWPLTLALAAAGAADLALPATDDLLAADDECAAAGDGGCALEALQLRGVRTVRKAANATNATNVTHEAEEMTTKPITATPPHPEMPHIPKPSPLPETLKSAPCLCMFDIDRTLTGKQGVVGEKCPGNKPVAAEDTAYGGGQLTLAQAAAVALNTTFCKSCYLGICSHGDGSGPGSAERTLIKEQVLVTSAKTANGTTVDLDWSNGPGKALVVVQPDGQKQVAVAATVKWYKDNHNIVIADQDVHFYDDRADNVEPFKQTRYSARQISCHARDPQIGYGIVGLCGATAQEIVPDKGVFLCKYPCEWGAWTSWGTCSGCGGAQGTQKRTRSPAVVAAGGGAPCQGKAREEQTCTGAQECGAPKDCHDAQPGDECHESVTWAMEKGIHEHPEWYPGLSASSTFKEFHEFIHQNHPKDCPEAPCQKGGAQSPRFADQPATFSANFASLLEGW